MKKKTVIYVIFIISILLSSCSVILSKMYGIKQLNSFNEKEYNNFIAKINNDRCLSYIISDSSQYKKVINLGHTQKEKNNLGQPIQILYFEKNVLKSYHINCLAKGSLTNLNWNTDNRFSVFIPKTAVNIDSLKINLKDYINIYPNLKNRNDKRYTILIFWTLMLDKISYSAIETVFSNLKQYKKENETSVILINTDKYFSTIN